MVNMWSDEKEKLENHMHAISLYFMHYNFCRVHKSLRVTPAMEAGLTDHIWELDEIIMMSETMPSVRPSNPKQFKLV